MARVGSLEGTRSSLQIEPLEQLLEPPQLPRLLLGIPARILHLREKVRDVFQRIRLLGLDQLEPLLATVGGREPALLLALGGLRTRRVEELRPRRDLDPPRHGLAGHALALGVVLP